MKADRSEPFLQKSLAELGRKYRLTAIYAFGSRADEMAKGLRNAKVDSEYPESDLDIGVLPEARLDITAKVELALALEELFNVSRVDLVVLSEAPPFLALDIVRGELLYVSDADAEAEYQLYILRRAGDLALWQHERWQMFVEAEV